MQKKEGLMATGEVPTTRTKSSTRRRNPAAKPRHRAARVGVLLVVIAVVLAGCDEATTNAFFGGLTRAGKQQGEANERRPHGLSVGSSRGGRGASVGGRSCLDANT